MIKITKTKNYLLILSDEVVNDVRDYMGRWHYEEGNGMNKFPTYLTDLQACKVILAHRPLDNAPFLDGVDVLPAFRQSPTPDPALIDSMAMRHRHDFGLLDDKMKDFIRMEMTQLWEEVVGLGFYRGEAVKYTEKELQTAFFTNHWNEEQKAKHWVEFKDSLKGIYPIGFEPEYSDKFEANGEKYLDESGVGEYHTHLKEVKKVFKKPKNTLNPRGQVQWVGKYVFKS